MIGLRNLFIILFVTLGVNAFAQDHPEGEAEGPPQKGEFLLEAFPSKKEAIFKAGESIGYDVKVYNSYGVVQEGTVGYLLTTLDDKEVARNAVKVKIGKYATDNFSLSIPKQKTPGFYKLAITINVTEYDDTLRRVFGVDVKQIQSATPKPPDFDEFWEKARTDLAAIKPEFKMTEQPELEENGISVYLVEMKSLNNLLIRGWLTIPKKRKPKERFPVWYVLPGYGGQGVKPIYAQGGLAVFSFNVRGQGNSRDIVHPTPDGYITTDIENKNRYILRGAIMDCLRGIDFIYSRPELDTANVICSGGSMGGYLSIITCSLDKRMKLCSANNPVWSDFRSLKDKDAWPLSALVKYSKAKFIPMNRLLDNLDYFDLKNFSPNLECKSLIGISLLDNLAPPYNQYTMLNTIKGEYKLFVYPNLTHEVPPSLFTYLSSWMMDEFGMF